MSPLVRRRLLLAAAGPAAYLLFLLFSRRPEWAEAVFGGAAGAAFPMALSRVTGLIPFSLAELLVLGFLTRQALGLRRGLRAVRREGRRWADLARAGGSRFAQDAGVVVALFYIVWGFHYARPPVEARLDLNGGDASAAEIAALAERMVEAANAAYLELHGVEDAGHPTRAAPPGELLAALDEGWRRAADLLGLAPGAVHAYGRPKAFLSSPITRRAGIQGMYFPFTGEALVTAGLPAVQQPYTLAHEQAHQRGFAPESDANLAGYFVAASAPHPLARYSAYVFAQRQLLAALFRADPDTARRLADRRLDGVWRDLEDLRRWNRENQRRGAVRVAASANEAFLRTNRVEGGTLSYSRSVWLLLAYARANPDALP